MRELLLRVGTVLAVLLFLLVWACVLWLSVMFIDQLTMAVLVLVVAVPLWWWFRRVILRRPDPPPDPAAERHRRRYAQRLTGVDYGEPD